MVAAAVNVEEELAFERDEEEDWGDLDEEKIKFDVRGTGLNLSIAWRKYRESPDLAGKYEALEAWVPPPRNRRHAEGGAG